MSLSPPLDTAAAAERLGVSERSLRLWREKDHERGPKYYRLGRRVRYYLADLDAWREGQAVIPKGKRPS